MLSSSACMAGKLASLQQPSACCRHPSLPANAVEWEQAALQAGDGGAGGAGFAAQQLFATADWRATQARRARIATAGRSVREAFGEAYDEQAAARMGKRQKRAGGGGVLPPVSDPTRTRVEGILNASEASLQAAAPGGAPGAGADLGVEQI